MNTQPKRRRLQHERQLAVLMRDPLLGPTVRAALQYGAKVGESRTRRMAFLFGLVVGVLVGAIVAIILVRLGAGEAQQ